MNAPGNRPFDQSPDCAALTMRQVLSGGERILTVYHDEDDHGWRFMGITDANESDGRIIAPHEVIGLDPTIAAVADIPPGWFASRSEVGGRWNRHENPRSLSDDSFGLAREVTPTSFGGVLFQIVGRLFMPR